MPNNGRITLCPYYVNERGLNVSCEDCIRRFRWPAKKKAWMDYYCDDHWQECQYAIELTRVYEEGGSMTELEIKSLKSELRKANQDLRKSLKREEDKEQKIKVLRRKAKVLDERNMELKAKQLRQEKKERAAFDQIQSLTQMYEARFAYLMDVFTGGVLSEAAVDEWSKGKSFAIVAGEKDSNGAVSVWKVVIKDERQSGRSESCDEKTGRSEAESAESKTKG